MQKNLLSIGSFADNGTIACFNDKKCVLYGKGPNKVIAKGKQPRSSLPRKSETRAAHSLDLIHIDLCGPFPTTSLAGSNYILVVVDDHRTPTRLLPNIIPYQALFRRQPNLAFSETLDQESIHGSKRIRGISCNHELNMESLSDTIKRRKSSNSEYRTNIGLSSP